MSRDFWSRRRNAVAAEAEAEARAKEHAEVAQDLAELEALPDDEILAKFDLPDPDTLDTADAVKNFMSHAVPERLKTRALRRLWRLNPVLANVDGLVDYGQDFTDAATVVEGLQTAYQVGKGMLAHVEALAAKEAANDDHVVTDENIADDDIPELADDLPELTQDPEPVPANTADLEEAPAPPSLNRRMTFQFESVT